MRYSTFHTLHIGAVHVKKGLPCQDMCLSEGDERLSIAVVSDGHGNRRHFRSERGSKAACKVATARIREFLEKTEDWTHGDREAQIPMLKNQICLDWRRFVLRDAENDPWSPEEIEEQKNILSEEQFARFLSGETALQAYGCTLCAVFAAEWGWGAIQLGDGSMVVIDADGTYRWPMPESIINSGHRTASLCSGNPMMDFRHVVEYGRPAGLIVYSDGIEKTFPDESREVAALLHWVWKNQRFGDENSLGTLTQLLGELTQRSSLGDDISIAGLIDPGAEDAAPRFGQNAQMKELQAMESQREELLTTIEYNRQRLSDIQRDAPGSDAEQQIRKILSRREADLAALTEAVGVMRGKLGLEPVSVPVPEEAPTETQDNTPEGAGEEQEAQPDRFFWGDEDEEDTPEADSSEYRWTPDEKDPRRRDRVTGEPSGQGSDGNAQKRREDAPVRPRKDLFDPFADFMRDRDSWLNEMLDEMNNLMNQLLRRL